MHSNPLSWSLLLIASPPSASSLLFPLQAAPPQEKHMEDWATPTPGHYSQTEVKSRCWHLPTARPPCPGPGPSHRPSPSPLSLCCSRAPPYAILRLNPNLMCYSCHRSIQISMVLTCCLVFAEVQAHSASLQWALVMLQLCTCRPQPCEAAGNVWSWQLDLEETRFASAFHTIQLHCPGKVSFTLYPAPNLQTSNSSTGNHPKPTYKPSTSLPFTLNCSLYCISQTSLHKSTHPAVIHQHQTSVRQLAQ